MVFGVNRGIKKIKYFSLCEPPGTHGFPQKMLANLVKPSGQLWLTYTHSIYINCCLEMCLKNETISSAKNRKNTGLTYHIYIYI